MDPQRKKELLKLIGKYNLNGVAVSMINQALTHKSYYNELKHNKGPAIQPEHNQRLEFLGDAVLGMLVAKALYNYYPTSNEGALTKKKSMAVCEPTLAEIGHKMDLGRYLLMGKGEQQTGGVKRTSNIADALEAVIGAIYLSSGLDDAEQFILKLWKPYLVEDKIARFSVDYKSVLQEKLMKEKKGRPDYVVVSTEGPEHNKIFTISLFIQGKEMGQAEASSRKKAEQKAAFEYLKTQGVL